MTNLLAGLCPAMTAKGARGWQPAGSAGTAADQPWALDRARLGDGPLAMLTAAELTALEHALMAVMGMG